MRTTLSIDESLLRRAKSTAALSGETLSAFVEGAIRQKLGSDNHRPPLVLKGKGGTRPGIDINNNAQMAEILNRDMAQNWHDINRRERPD